MKKILLVLLMSVVVFSTITAQTYDINKLRQTDVSKLSDAQIRQISNEIERRGYSLNQVIQFAKLQGATDKQISDLRKRIEETKHSKNKVDSKSSSADLDLQQINLDDFNFSRVEEYKFTAEDSLVFGFNLFNNNNLTFEPNINMPTPDGYILGPGDDILINVWGQSEISYDLMIMTNGTITIPNVGPIAIAGLTLADARGRIINKLKGIYNSIGAGTYVSVTTSNLRTITVSVLGEVNAPGTYTISSVSSLFNVLYLSGGPSKNGSFRNIQLMRGGKLVATLDVYDFLLNYNSDVNVPLYDGDMIVVPTYQKRVAVGGAFKRVGYFEAKEGESADDIIRYAGGFRNEAMTSHLGVTRVSKYGKEYKTIDEASSFMVMNGDSISVPVVDLKRFDNIVTIKGGVFAAGDYEYKEGMKLSELLVKAGGLKENAFLSRGVIIRKKEDFTLLSLNFNVGELKNGQYDTELKDKDYVYIATIDETQEWRTLTIKGAVKNPGVFDYCEGMTVGDLILLAGGLKNDAAMSNVEIVSKLSESIADTSCYSVADGKYISITRDLKLDDEGNSYSLKPFDVVTIREHLSASFKGTVRMSGEVRFVGDYEMVSKDENILTMINRAGGLTASAYVQGARLYRRVKLTEKEKILKKQQALAQSADAAKANSILNTDTYELVSIDLSAILKSPGSYMDLKLQDGDEIVIPSRLQTVRVSGQVLNPVSLTWSKKSSARRFINNAGGFSSKAKKSKTYVVYPDGHAEATRHFLFIKNYPDVEAGCEVVVPEREERQSMSAIQLVSMLSSLTTAAVLIVNVIRK